MLALRKAPSLDSLMECWFVSCSWKSATIAGTIWKARRHNRGLRMHHGRRLDGRVSGLGVASGSMRMAAPTLITTWTSKQSLSFSYYHARSSMASMKMVMLPER